MVAFLEPRLRPVDGLPSTFQYSTQFLQYLLFQEKETRETGKTTLHWIWPLDVQYQLEIASEVLASYTEAHPASNDYYFVPFARDSGDLIWFFSPDGIQFVDLGWSVWMPKLETPSELVEFINVSRAGSDLPRWEST